MASDHYDPETLARAVAQLAAKRAADSEQFGDVLQVDAKGMLYAVTLQLAPLQAPGAQVIATRLVLARGPERAVTGTVEQTGSTYQEGDLAWVVPVAGVHHFEFTGAPPLDDDGQPLVVRPQVACPRCKGKGTMRGQGTLDTCVKCNRTGRVDKHGAEAQELVAVEPRWEQQVRPITNWPGGLQS